MKQWINRRPELRNTLLGLNDWLFVQKQIISGWCVRIPALLQHISESKVIAGPGTLGFKGGTFNPGSIWLKDKIVLLAKAQEEVWYKARGKKRRLFLKGKPVIFVLQAVDLHAQASFPVPNILNYPNLEDDFAIEDFRMFPWKEKLMVTHSLVKKQKSNEAINQAGVSSNLAVLSDDLKTLSCLGSPSLDFETNQIEKNWVYAEVADSLYLFYSMNPYRVLRLVDENQLKFETVVNRETPEALRNPGGFGTMVSFSVIPIDYDEKYWLQLIHQIDNRKNRRYYYHWATLVNKKTLLPEKITSQPVFSGTGARGRVPGYNYITSILRKDDVLLVFAGEGDIYSTVTQIKLKKVEDLLINLNQHICSG